MGDNKENSEDVKTSGVLEEEFEAEGILGSVSTSEQPNVALARSAGGKKKRKVKSAKSGSTESSNGGTGLRRASSARTSKGRMPRTRNITSQYSQKKLNSKRKRGSNASSAAASEEDANKYKKDFDEAIAKLTNPNLLTKAKIGDSSESSNNSALSQDGIKKAAVVRRVRSAQSVVGPRPHLASPASTTQGEANRGSTLSKQTLSMNGNTLPLLVKENGIGISKPFMDKQRPSTASGAGSGRSLTQTEQSRGVRARSDPVTRPPSAPNPSSVIQSRLRTYFSGAPASGTRSMVATTLRATAPPDTAADSATGGSGSGATAGSQSASANTSSPSTQTGPIKLRTTTSTITLRPINGLSLISASSESLSSNNGGLNSLTATKAMITNKNNPPPPKPILKSADVVKAKTKRNVRFALPDDDSD